MVSCLKQAVQEPDHSIKLTFDTVRLTPGITQYLAAKNYHSNEINWSSSDTSIIKIDNAGVINAIRVGQATIVAKSKVYPVSAKCIAIVSGNTIAAIKLSDVAVGSDGSVFAIGTDIVSPTGGFGIYKLVNNKLNKLPYCAGVRIAVGPDGKPWVVNKSNLIYRYRDSTQAWQQMPGTATDIAIGADGSVFAIGTVPSSLSGGYNIMKWNGSSWTNMPECAGIRIAAGPDGIPLVVNNSNLVYKYDGTRLWNVIVGVSANDIGIGANGAVYVTGNDATAAIYKLNQSGWTPVAGASGVNISVTPLGLPVYIDKAGMLHIP